MHRRAVSFHRNDRFDGCQRAEDASDTTALSLETRPKEARIQTATTPLTAVDLEEIVDMANVGLTSLTSLTSPTVRSTCDGTAE